MSENKGELHLGGKVLPITDWKIDFKPETNEVDPDLSRVLEAITESKYEIHGTLDPCIYEHTFAPATKRFIPELWCDALQSAILNELYASQAFIKYLRRLRLKNTRERRRKKIKRKQKRAAFRRWKKGLA